MPKCLSVSKRLFVAIIFSCLCSTALAASKPMKIVYFDSYPPRFWLENGEMKGILVDIISEAADRIGVPLLHEGYPWARAQAMVEAGQADAFITVPTEKRKAYTEVSTEPVIRFNLYIATQKNNPHLEQLKKVTDIDGLKPFRLVDYYGNGFAETRLKDHNIEWVPQISAVYSFLASGKADALVISDRGFYDLKRFGYQDQLIILPQPLNSVSFNLCIGKNSAYKGILPKIDRVLKQMQEEGRQKSISEKYFQ